jgi:predicted lipoprotein with Yx(FWY)xxD motif
MRNLGYLSFLAAAALCVTASDAAYAQAQRGKAQIENYVHEPIPAGFKVMISELEGPIYTDTNGRALYTWPRKELRNGGTADMKGSASACENVKTTENAGLMSPYPAGFTLPDVATRPTCTEAWPPVMAAADAKAVGKWSIIPRKDGSKQWAYEGQVLYTSHLDKKAGDTIGGTREGRRYGGGGGGDSPAARVPIGPPADIPGQFIVDEDNLNIGRRLILDSGYVVYTWDGDAPNKSNCKDACLKQWAPVLAPEVGSQAREDWTIVERSPGLKQWAFRKQPLYTLIGEAGRGTTQGIDVPGWRLVYTQVAPPPPHEFTQQESPGGIVLADAKGSTIYIYNCGDDSLDQLACDHPDTPQEYRYAVCGGGDPARCLKTFPYVIADKASKSVNAVWTIMSIDPASGHRAKTGQADALSVWAYRDRPVFTFVRDEKPGSIRAQSWGEFYGARNGFKAYWIREEFQGR